MSGPYSNIGGKIVNKNGYDTLECTLQPGASIITNQDTLCYMQDGIATKATTGTSGISGMFRRAVTESSFFQNAVTNSANSPRKIVFSPLLQGSIVEIVIQAGQTWRFADKTFLACSPNLQVSGNLNIFRNFRMSFATGNLTYVTVSAPKEAESVGVVWVTGYGGVERHDIQVGPESIPLLINSGCFLGMLSLDNTVDYWKDYTTLSVPGGVFGAFMTNIGFVMKLGEKDPTHPMHSNSTTFTVYTQTLNPRNLEEYVDRIAKRELGNNSSIKTTVAETATKGFLSFLTGSGRRRKTRKTRRKIEG
jgi:uncharacterized protein (AIM24 family)